MPELEWPAAAVIITAIAAIITTLIKHAPPRQNGELRRIHETILGEAEKNRRRWRALFRILRRPRKPHQ